VTSTVSGGCLLRLARSREDVLRLPFLLLHVRASPQRYKTQSSFAIEAASFVASCGFESEHAAYPVPEHLNFQQQQTRNEREEMCYGD
jgi:hypothetical protein